MLPQTQTQIPNPQLRSRLLTELYTAQEKFGWLSPEAIQEVAKTLSLTQGQVYSTASFYTMFKLEPRGKYHFQVCEGLTCYLVGGAEPIIDYLKGKLGIEDGISPDGRFSLEVVQCLAACDMAPVLRVNDELVGFLTDGKIQMILNELAVKS